MDKRQFRFEWRTALLAAALLPIMVNLGFWQLRRADENRELMRVAEQQRQRSPIAFAQAPFVSLQQVTIRGRWSDRFFLLENQMHEGRNGYHVIGVIALEDGRNVLVNRGWIAAPTLRSELPVAPPVPEIAVERGEIYISPYLLQNNESVFAENGWPRRIGKLHIPGLVHELGFEVLPMVVRLREGSPSALTVQWPVVNISPEKNIAYAIQWFAMSVALIVFYLALSFRREVTDDTNNGMSS
ncbi:MAG TPA: SURF1 family protein [Pseudomonadales bacterium]|nr:SURF1 family protein [Pseudomonadales bacterium]